MTLAVVALCAAALVTQAPRWLRLAQREHYLASGVTRFALRWWRVGANPLLAAFAAVSAAVAFFAPAAGVATAAVTVLAPVGLGLRGRTSKLVWTRRLRTLAAVVVLVDAALVLVASVAGAAAAGVAALACLGQPLVVDAALAVTGPFERRSARRYVRSASAKLRAVRPITVAITGSYGKTTTKGYARHLIGATRSVLASPASFNNTGGLSRTLNEHLAPGTDVFIAEMGMYGPGEIAAMCDWVRPSIGVIVNIGPVHLERVGSLDGIVAAKGEIVADVDVAVLNVSAHRLRALADELEASGRRVVRVATDDTPARVVVHEHDGDLVVVVDGAERHRIEHTTAQAANVAAAVGIVLALDLPLEPSLSRLDSLPAPEHRQQVEQSATGITVIDNTFSSNPASGRASLALLARHARPGRRAVLVTPGMVELGPVQREENEHFAAAASALCTDIVVVGHTNRAALRAGVDGPALHLAATRDQAVAWVRANLGEGDTVLYENDLPDHYP
jgi:UDP-N-acetylmuramoyl-tripeptide--D-alanyl-D-alanine ligase